MCQIVPDSTRFLPDSARLCRIAFFLSRYFKKYKQLGKLQPIYLDVVLVVLVNIVVVVLIFVAVDVGFSYSQYNLN